MQISSLRIGDEVTITITSKVSEVQPEEGYFTIDPGPYIDYWTVNQAMINNGTVSVQATRALPTEHGVYVVGDNAGSPEDSFLYILSEDGWEVYRGRDLPVKIGVDAAEIARVGNDTLGGLVRLGVAQ